MLNYLKQHFFPTPVMDLNRWVTYGVMCLGRYRIVLTNYSSNYTPYLHSCPKSPRLTFQLSFDIWLAANIFAHVASGSWPHGTDSCAHRFPKHMLLFDIRGMHPEAAWPETPLVHPIGDVQIWLKAWCSWFNQLFQLLQNSPFVDRSRLVFAISTAILHRENPWNDRERTPNDRERTVKFVKLCHGHFWKFWYLLAALFDSSEILVSTAALFDSSEQWRFHRDLMSLQDLPFDLTELNWGKLSTVKKILKLSEEEAVQVMTHVLGPRPSET